jgi:hypothetical protein
MLAQTGSTDGHLKLDETTFTKIRAVPMRDLRAEGKNHLIQHEKAEWIYTKVAHHDTAQNLTAGHCRRQYLRYQCLLDKRIPGIR